MPATATSPAGLSHAAASAAGDPFAALRADVRPQTPLRAAITAATRLPEAEALAPLLARAQLGPAQAEGAHALAFQLAQALRQRKRAVGRAGLVQGLLQEFSLSSHEGVALMCLAEALLRIPDAATRDALIRDKISGGQWQAHLGQSPSLFVNAAAWGLLITGKLVATHSERTLGQSLTRLIGQRGEPLIRKAVDMAMRMMGEQFVTGETIGQALKNARPHEAQGFRYSYDMLGEAALTAHDAARYLASYEQAIDAIGAASAGRGVVGGPGISIKLSALHPRYSRAQRARVMAELYPRVLALAVRARGHDIGLNIDAEEADRLELSLDLLEKLCFAPELAGWDGIGFVIQAYQKRCPRVIDWLVELGRRSGHRLMVRLVKGAYWDSEIKRAQVDGQADYPVYTRKPHTDVSYLACARALLAAPDAIYPQFATHNAHTVAAIAKMAEEVAGPDDAPPQYEFQCLHGMGEPLYEQVVRPVAQGGLGRPCRIYAPVGTHETLLAYLVRRLLENGANTSFVNRIADAQVPIDTLIEDPVQTVAHTAQREGAPPGAPHPRIPLPAALYGAARLNSAGMDLSDEDALHLLSKALLPAQVQPALAAPLMHDAAAPLPAAPVRNPADQRDVVGHVADASDADIAHALAAAQAHAAAWAAAPPAERAAALNRAADALQADMPQLMGLLVREAGKSWPNAIAEVREAIDFLRFYAHQAATQLDNATHAPLGPVVCISPWNFPLAIFTGQVAAALAAGNVVLAKPAEQTPLIAHAAVRTLLDAGVPRAALQLLPGDGARVGAALVGDARVRGVMFTGSTEVARLLQRQLARRLNPGGQPVPLIAETGGQNAMIVDSSALAEQVVQDVMASAFDSAGQRCSALRVLCLQDDVADRTIAMLQGAMAEARVADPRALATDIGPVIDAEAQAGIQRHIDTLRASGHAVHQPPVDAAATEHGTFIAPTLIEIDHLHQLQREVFGPVLHVLRYPRAGLDALIDAINATGYGLTAGVHTRIDETIARVAGRVQAGNLYVNRNMVGAVVGVQPFGGEGLSGTGPKAGGPLYLLRLLARQPVDAAQRAVAAFGHTPVEDKNTAQRPPDGREQLQKQLQDKGLADCADTAGHLQAALPGAVTPLGAPPHALDGPTGERNSYALAPRRRVLCLASQWPDRITQLAAVRAVGATAVWPADAATAAGWAQLPVDLLAHIALTPDWRAPEAEFDAVLLHGEPEEALAVQHTLAQRPGPIVGLTVMAPGSTTVPLERLLVEHSVSVNTAAAGGNASLMVLG
ncbi:trifunctional transcriptional regulator/proline dehydrogenase/L-glutamate gamma-semialdehyde dehydrogenase [Ottowia oryzae]|nr:trifunctional transcriptional regulator/proline dehydrogenase/L-glutamate gamma-semialdehyde dehydrogenase [Ottowia oryzae]